MPSRALTIKMLFTLTLIVGISSTRSYPHVPDERQREASYPEIIEYDHYFHISND